MPISANARLELAAAFKLERSKLDPARKSQPNGTTLSAYIGHGALQQLAEATPELPVAATFLKNTALAMEVPKLEKSVKDFFYKLDGDEYRYDIPTSLISHLTFPHEGRTWSTDNSHSDLSVVMTFIGQFIDHDLTKNIIDLTARDQDKLPLQDFATPLIDLDSVYGPRFDNDPLTGLPPSPAPMSGTQFLLRKDAGHEFDASRDAMGKALIPDARNDENQLILQVHVLVMRLHNTLARRNPGWDGQTIRRETINCWQSMVINDYLPSIVNKRSLDFVLGEIKKPGHGNLVHKPAASPTPGINPLRMPHEFGLGFRFGHSQLRSHYSLNPKYSGRNKLALFDNRATEPFQDLRGGRELDPDRAIDWPFFLNSDVPSRTSNRIDHHVTRRVFDLPESAIPDSITKFGNLPQRNLVRSANLHLASGEYLARHVYNLEVSDQLRPIDVEWEDEYHFLFDNKVTKKGVETREFATPLWYYILREAQVKENGDKLGPLGGRLVAEVVAGGVYYDPESYVNASAPWQSALTGNDVVKFADIVAYILSPD